MPKSPPHRLYVHLAWTTLGRVPTIAPARRASVESHLLAACRRLGAEPVETCVLPDRVHLLVRLPAGLSVYDLGDRVRVTSEVLLRRAGYVVRWSREFAARSVSPREVRRVRRRIASLGLDGERVRVRAPATPDLGSGESALPVGWGRNRARWRG